MAKISVILTSYNHEKYIRQSIESVLCQSFSDLELIVLDDASSDSSWSIINSYSDARLKVFRSQFNGEISLLIEEAIRDVSTGEYIAIHHSDDVWEPEKLARQIAHIDQHPDLGAIFTWVQVIDETGTKLKNDWFNRGNQSQWAWLNELFNEKNALNHPSALIRKACYQKIGGYRYGLGQIDDAEFWSRLLISHPIYVLEEKLTLHRLFSDNSNVSGDRPEVVVRSSHEWNFLRENFLALRSFEEIVQVFPELMPWRRLNGFNAKFLLAMACVQSPHRSAWVLGLQWLFELLNDAAQRKQLAELYAFTDFSFIKLSATLDSYRMADTKQHQHVVIEYENKIKGVLSEYATLQGVVAERDIMLQDAKREHASNLQRLQEEYGDAAKRTQAAHHETLFTLEAKVEELQLTQQKNERDAIEFQQLAKEQGARAAIEYGRAETQRARAEVAEREALHQREQAQNIGIQKEAVAARLAAMESSSSWRATAPVRRFLANRPRTARAGRRAAKLIWWSATFRLLQKSREWRARRHAAAYPAPPEPAHAPANEKFAPPAAPLPDVDKLSKWLSAAKDHCLRSNRPMLSHALMERYFESFGFAPSTVQAWTTLLQTPGAQRPEASAEFALAAESFESHARIGDFLSPLQASPLFDAHLYRKLLSINGTDVDALRHYLLIGEPLGIRPSSAFDPSYYGRKYPDVAESGMNCLFHYASDGQREGRRATMPVVQHRTGGAPIDPRKENVIVVVHETSRTGAPILGWNIAATLARKYNVFCVLLADGALTPEFEAVSSETIGPLDGVRTAPLEAELGLAPLFSGRLFKYAVVNSIESRVTIEVCAKHTIPTLLLVHEYGSYVWPASALREALDMATEVVFPAASVARSSMEVHPALRRREVHIEPQGMSLLPSGHAEVKQPLTALMQELAQKRADGMLLVTGAGSVNIRKGVDSFIAVAAAAKRLGAARPIHFLWVGGGYRPNDDMGYSVYLKEQMARSEVEADITFMEEVSDLEPIYGMSDVFMLASRLDPLPNVSIDATWRGIPTVCFKEASGMADLLLADPETAVGVVPYMDTHAAAEVIVRLASNELARAQLGKATRRFAASTFNMERYVARLDRLGGAHDAVA